MKKIALVILMALLVCLFSACPTQEAPDKPGNNQPEQGDTTNEQEEATKMYITIYGNKLEVTLEDNAAVRELVALLKQGDITYTANDYGGFEKVGGLGHTLTSNDASITTEPGDVVLYVSNSICIMVGSNTWAYTRIGKINGYSTNQLKELVGIGKGSAEVTLSLT